MSSKVAIPVSLDLTGLRILFVGAGAGTRTKLAALVDQDPMVRIVAPEISSQVQALADKLTDAQVHKRAFVESDLAGVSLVYGMTNDPAVNARLSELCRARGLWSNIAQNRGGLSFSSPAVAKKYGIIATFSSETGQPGAAVKARDDYLKGPR